MRTAFNEEYHRGKKVYHAISGLAPQCGPMAQIASGVAQTLAEADAFVAESFEHDQKEVQLTLQEEHLTQRFIELRSSAYHIILGMPGEGPNSNALPPMDYKRLIDRRSGGGGGSDEAVPPPSGSAPPTNG